MKCHFFILRVIIKAFWDNCNKGDLLEVILKSDNNPVQSYRCLFFFFYDDNCKRYGWKMKMFPFLFQRNIIFFQKHISVSPVSHTINQLNCSFNNMVSHGVFRFGSDCLPVRDIIKEKNKHFHPLKEVEIILLSCFSKLGSFYVSWIWVNTSREVLMMFLKAAMLAQR